jgi:hypothetical protein
LHALHVHSGWFAICRLAADDPVPAWVPRAAFSSITRTDTELSIVCAQAAVPPGVRAERGWRLIGVQGPLDLSMVGVLAGLAATLAGAGISILAIGTFDTDYVLVRDSDLPRAVGALAGAGYAVA